MTPSLHDALFDRVLDRARSSTAPDSSANKPALFGAVRAAGWRPLPALRQEGSLRRSQTDVALARAFRDGDADAFDELFTRHHGKLIAYARRSGCAAESQDFAQEAFLSLLHTAPIENPGFNVPAYLFTVVRNRALKLGLARAREATVDLATVEPQDPTPNPLAQLITQHSIERVAVLLDDRCTPAEQAVLALVADDLRNTEIAEQLQLTASNVGVIRHRALTKLRAALDEDPS